ncbi:MAG: carotenoid biosynthesis protein [Rubrivivax sp.]|nr:carotenoid biosynthesis protein [Pyrinomonadaceae bacterium]
MKTGGLELEGVSRWRRKVLALFVPAFAVLWVGGVASQWLDGPSSNQGWLASLFLLLAGLIVLLGVRARRDVSALVGIALLGLAVEAIGVRFRVPFGAYEYTDALRPQLLSVPLVMGFAWMALIAYACDITNRLRLPAWGAAVAAALWTTVIDLIIDPLAANELGYWRWADAGYYYGIPATNFVGWFVTGLLACRLFGRRLGPNFWAGCVGASIVLFFALIALANSLHVPALIGLLLCAVQLSVTALTRHQSDNGDPEARTG